MKRRLITACIFLIISLVTGITGLAALENGCDKLAHSLHELRSAAQNVAEETDNASEVNSAAGRASALWEKEKTLFHVLTNHTELSEFETGMKQLVFFAESGDYNELIKISERCLEEINHIKRSSELSISNVF